MGQIVSSAAKPKRCNANQLSQVPTPAAGEHILVSSDNSMNAAGQGDFNCYIVGDGTTAASALTLHAISTDIPEIDNPSYIVRDVTINSSGNWVNYIGCIAAIYPLQGTGFVSFTAVSGVSHNVKLLSTNIVNYGQSAGVISSVSASGTQYDATSKYLFVQIYQGGTDRTPSAIYVNGYDLVQNISYNLKKIFDSVYSIQNTLSQPISTSRIADNGVTWDKRTKTGSFGILFSQSKIPLLFDSVNKTITIEEATRLVVGKKQIPTNPWTTRIVVDISSYNNGVLAIDISANNYLTPASLLVVGGTSAAALENLLSNENCVIICAWALHGQIVHTASSYSIDGNLLGIDLNNIDTDAIVQEAKDGIYAGFPTINPCFDLIALPSGISWWSDFIHVKIGGVDEMWFFTGSTEDHSVFDGKCHRVRMSDWTYIGYFTHNFGHCNTVQYDVDSDVLLMSNLPGHTAHPSALYIFYNVSSWASESSVNFNSVSPTIIDLTPMSFTGNNAAFFGENSYSRRNIVYVMTAYGVPGKFAKIVLGMGTNQLTNGTYDSTRTADSEYNGTYDILLPPISYAQPEGWDGNKLVIQGGDFVNGRVITTNGHDQILGFIYSIIGDNIQRTLIENVPRKADGTIDYSVAEGLCVKDGYVYQGCIKISNDFRETHSTTGYYLVKYPLPY